MFNKATAIKFIGLNVVRFLSIVALLLVFSSNIVILADDIKAVHKHNPASFTVNDSNGQPETFECDYLEASSVPNQAAGIFWAFVNRLFILGLTFLLILSEFGWPEAFFKNYMPVLGPDFGVGILGTVQCIITASVLSHHVDEFPLAAGWLLFVIGIFNILLGGIFRSRSKILRSVSSFREERAKLLPGSGGPSMKDLETASGSIFSNRGGPVSRQTTGGSNYSEDKGFLSHGFGRQGEKKAALGGYSISAPVGTLPKYAPPYAGGSGEGGRF